MEKKRYLNMTDKEKITLILEDNQFVVDKSRVVEKSRYFESLFSHNFSDSNNHEQLVNYKVTPSVLQVCYFTVHFIFIKLFCVNKDTT